MNVALIGSVSSSWHTLRGLVRGGVQITAVLGLDERHAQRVSDYRSLRELAESNAVPYLSFDLVTEPAVSEFLQAHRPDLLFVVGLSQLVPKQVRGLARADSIGFHPTLLPRGRGRAPVAWTILLGEPAAANLFFLTDEPDAGDLIDQRPVEVRPDDYAQDLIDRTNQVLEQMVTDLAPRIIQGALPRTPQDHSQATYYPKRTPADGRIDWSLPAENIYRLIRAASHPYPGAFTFHQERKLIIWRARPANSPAGKPGEVMSVDDSVPLVRAGAGALRLTDIQWMSVSGVRPLNPLTVGDLLTSDPTGS
jgi:methionyl-tRNA formyltransferase